MRIIQAILVVGVVAVVHFIVQTHLFLSQLGLKLTWADAADPAFTLGEQAKYLLSIVGFPLLWFADVLPISSIPYLEWGWLALNSGLWGGTAYFLLRAFHQRVQQHVVVAGEVQIGRPWLMAVVVVLSLIIGSTFVRAVDSLLAHRFSPGLIDTTEAAIINTLEMGLYAPLRHWGHRVDPAAIGPSDAELGMADTPDRGGQRRHHRHHLRHGSPVRHLRVHPLSPGKPERVA